MATCAPRWSPGLVSGLHSPGLRLGRTSAYEVEENYTDNLNTLGLGLLLIPGMLRVREHSKCVQTRVFRDGIPPTTKPQILLQFKPS